MQSRASRNPLGKRDTQVRMNDFIRRLRERTAQEFAEKKITGIVGSLAIAMGDVKSLAVQIALDIVFVQRDRKLRLKEIAMTEVVITHEVIHRNMLCNMR